MRAFNFRDQRLCGPQSHSHRYCISSITTKWLETLKECRKGCDGLGALKQFVISDVDAAAKGVEGVTSDLWICLGRIFDFQFV